MRNEKGILTNRQFLPSFVLLILYLMCPFPGDTSPLSYQRIQGMSPDEPMTAGNLEKSPTWAMISSALLPGGGQFYTENYLKGLFFALTQGTLSGMTLYEHIKTREGWRRFEQSGLLEDYDNYSRHFDRRRNLLFIDTGVWILAVADAYISAHFYKFDELSFSLSPKPTLSAVFRF